MLSLFQYYCRFRLRYKRKERIGKKVRKLMKNMPKKGRSARNGNAPAPYTKYNKQPYKYAFERKIIDMGPSGSVKERIKQKRYAA